MSIGMVRLPGQIRERPEDGLERDGMKVAGWSSHVSSDCRSRLIEEHVVSSTAANYFVAPDGLNGAREESHMARRRHSSVKDAIYPACVKDMSFRGQYSSRDELRVKR
jgi:hypothetical protein